MLQQSIKLKVTARSSDLHRENEDFNESRSQINAIAFDMIEKTKSLETSIYVSQVKKLCNLMYPGINAEFLLFEIYRDLNVKIRKKFKIKK
jgi:hypothetical protein